MKKSNIRLILTTFAVLFIFASCGGESKEDLRDKIEKLQTQVNQLKREVDERDAEIEELHERLDNARSHAEDVQSALDDGSFSDAYDCADDVVYETDY